MILLWRSIDWRVVRWYVPGATAGALLGDWAFAHMTSAVVGASGLLVNPFYLNYGLMKGAMLATRAVNSLAIQLVKIRAYLRCCLARRDLPGVGRYAGGVAAARLRFIVPWVLLSCRKRVVSERSIWTVLRLSAWVRPNLRRPWRA